MTHHLFKKQLHQLLDPEDYCSIASTTMNISIVVIIVASIVALTLETDAELLTEYRLSFIYFEVFALVFFTLEYIARTWSAPSDSKFRSYRHHLFSYNSIVDLVALFPLYIGLLIGADLRFIMLLRLFRLLKLFKYFAPLSMMVEVLKAEYRAFLSALLVMFILVFVSAAGIYFFEKRAQPEVFGSIPEAMWWSIVTLTTLGYGDVVPITLGGRIFTGLMTVFAIGIVSLPAGMLASRFSEELSKRKLIFAEKVQEMNCDAQPTQHQQVTIDSIRQQLCLSESDANFIFKNLSDKPVKQRLFIKHDTCPHCGKNIELGE